MDNEEVMVDTLRLLSRYQSELWRKDRLEGFTGSTEEVRTLGFALIAEILEFTNELGWKSWKPAPQVNRDAAIEEWADILAFFGSLTALMMTKLSVYPEELVRAYFLKKAENHRRFEERDRMLGRGQNEGNPR